MRTRMLGLAVCLLGMASAANAGFKASETSKSPVAATQATGDASKLPVATTHGYTWSNRQGTSEASKAPVASTYGYLWRK